MNPIILLPEEERRTKLHEKLVEMPQSTPDFMICRQKRNVSPDRMTDWDREDRCRNCSIPVIYDSQSSSSNTPHICDRCAHLLYSQFRQLSALDPCRPTERDMHSTDFFTKLAVSVSQHQHGESGRAPTTVPDQEKLTAQVKRKS